MHGTTASSSAPQWSSSDRCIAQGVGPDKAALTTLSLAYFEASRRSCPAAMVRGRAAWQAQSPTHQARLSFVGATRKLERNEPDVTSWHDPIDFFSLLAENCDPSALLYPVSEEDRESWPSGDRPYESSLDLSWGYQTAISPGPLRGNTIADSCPSEQDGRARTQLDDFSGDHDRIFGSVPCSPIPDVMHPWAETQGPPQTDGPPRDEARGPVVQTPAAPHNDPKPALRCDECRKPFRHKCSLQRHRKEKHQPEHVWVCPVQGCKKSPKEYRRKDNFKRHCERKHREVPLSKLGLNRPVARSIANTASRAHNSGHSAPRTLLPRATSIVPYAFSS
ncbi:hypothetical protein VTK73DRAFT_9332 [Phialemonium thermophilum]|uniref:C2H2-type domain-containing protein n=1 Tax=Phialemonium thermophilum TaxID=223376 RepID=A0ABR3W2X3_9PEZI